MIGNKDLISQMRAITVSREYGSGGGEIASRLARRLNWQLIDHEVVVQVAQELGVSIAEAEAHDEHVEGLVSRILTSMQTIEPAVFANSSVPVLTNGRAYQEALLRVVQAAVNEGHVVIVGRGSQVLLRQFRDVLHIRVVAPLELRTIYVMHREGLNADDARSRIQLKDRDRDRYLQAEYSLRPDDPHLYDVVVNTAIIDLDSAVDLISVALERKATRLAVPVEDLGPGAGLARYPGHPGDFRPPENLAGPSA